MLFYFFKYLYQVHSFKNNFNDEEMLISHLMWFVNYIIMIKITYKTVWEKNVIVEKPWQDIFLEKNVLP